MSKRFLSIIFVLSLIIVLGVFTVFYFLWQISSPSDEEIEAYEKARIGNFEDLENYMKKYPDGVYSEEISELQERWELEKEAFHKLASGTSEDCQEFLKKFPESMFKTDVEKMYIEKLEQEIFTMAKEGESLKCENYLRKYPDSEHVDSISRKFLSLPIYVMKVDCSTIYSVDVSSNNNLMAIGTNYKTEEQYRDRLNVYKGEVIVYNIENIRKPKKIFAFRPTDMDDVNRVRFSPDGNLLAIGAARMDKSQDYELSVEVILFDVSNEAKIQEISRFNSEVASVIRTMSFSPNGQYLAYGTYEHLVILDIQNPRKIKEIDRARCHDHDLQKISYSPDGKYIATCSAKDTGRCNDDGTRVYEGEFKLWDIVDTGEIYEVNSTLCHDRTCLTLAFSNNGKYLATGAFNDELKIGNVSDVENVYETALFKKFEDSVHNIFFTKNDKNLIFSTRSEIYICKNKNFKEIEPTRELKCSGFICDMGLSHDDSVITACTNDCKIYFWPTEKYVEKMLHVK